MSRLASIPSMGLETSPSTVAVPSVPGLFVLSAGDIAAAAAANALLLEDGTSYLLQEDGTSKLLLES